MNFWQPLWGRAVTNELGGPEWKERVPGGHGRAACTVHVEKEVRHRRAPSFRADPAMPSMQPDIHLCRICASGVGRCSIWRACYPPRGASLVVAGQCRSRPC